MSYVKPDAVVAQMIGAGEYKASLGAKDLLIRGALSGALLGFATTLAISATVQSGMGLVGALVFPVGFVMIVLLGLELITGSFALLPVALFEKKICFKQMSINWSYVFFGNLIGSLLYAVLYVIASTKFGNVDSSPVIDLIIKIAEAKTIGYEKLGTDGLITVFVKAILCNWMVTLGVVMALTSTTTIGKIFAMWLPIITFFAQGFEHSVVNMFVIPAGIMLGAKVSVAQWWLTNEIPVTIGNLVGGLLFTGLALYLTHHKND